MPSWKKLITSGSSAVLSNITLSNLQAQGSELTSVMVTTGGVVGTRELSSTAFSTMDNYVSFTAAGDVGSAQTISSGNTLTFTGSGGITTTGVAGDSVDIALNAAQTSITSILNTSLVVGRDSTDQIKFGIDNQIIFRVGNADGVTFKASGQIAATSLDISGDVDVDGTLETDALTIGGTTSVPFESGDHSKLDGIEASADVTDTINVEAAGALMDSELTTIALVKGLTAGISDGNVLTANDVVADNDFLRINATEVEGLTVAEVLSALSVESGATADQSNAEIVAAVEAGSDSNTFTDADHTKLNAIEASADVTDTDNVDTAGALMDSEVDADIKTLSLPASTTISTFGASLIDDAAASNARTTLGLGTASTTAATAYATSAQGSTADSALQPADTMYIGTTSVAFNRGSGGLTLAGLTLTTPNLGTPSTLVGTNISGTASSLTVGKITVTDSNTSANYDIPFNNAGALLEDDGAFYYNPGTATLVVSNINISGTQTFVDTATLVVTSSIIFEGATSDGYETTLTVVDPTEDQTWTLPNATDTVVGRATTDTLTNKTINSNANTLHIDLDDLGTFTGTLAEFNSGLQSDSFVSLTGTETLTNKTLTSPDINTPDIDGGNIDGADITVGSGKTLNVSAGTLTLAANQISGDKVEGGTIAATTITALTTAGITATSNIDIGTYELRASTFESDVAPGTAPFTIASTTAVSNLNADLLDGQHGSYYTDFSNITVTSGEVSNAMLANSSINFGGISLSLGGSDTTPAFALADATGLPIVAGTTGTLSVARGGTGVTTSTGTGNTVLSASPTFTGTINAAAGTFSGNVSGSATSTGSFAQLRLNVSSLSNSGSEVVTVDGTQGRLFSVTDEMSGSIFSANTIAGLPVIEAFSDNTVTLGPFSSPMKIDSSGNISASADIVAEGDVVAYYTSDIRLKDNLQIIEGSLDKIGEINGYEFDWNEKAPGWAQERGHDVGVIAQEVEKVLPEVVQKRKNGYLGVDYKRIIPLLIESVKELKQEIEDLKKKVI